MEAARCAGRKRWGLLNRTLGKGCRMVIEYTPHAAQMEIHRARGFRFRTVCTGRRFGKTLCMAAELQKANLTKPMSSLSSLS